MLFIYACRVSRVVLFYMRAGVIDMICPLWPGISFIYYLILFLFSTFVIKTSSLVDFIIQPWSLGGTTTQTLKLATEGRTRRLLVRGTHSHTSPAVSAPCTH